MELAKKYRRSGRTRSRVVGIILVVLVLGYRLSILDYFSPLLWLVYSQPVRSQIRTSRYCTLFAFSVSSRESDDD